MVSDCEAGDFPEVNEICKIRYDRIGNEPVDCLNNPYSCQFPIMINLRNVGL